MVEKKVSRSVIGAGTISGSRNVKQVAKRLPRARHYDDWSKENTRDDFQPAGCVFLHEDNRYVCFFLRVQSLAPAHRLPSTSGERRKIRHDMTQMH